MAKSRESIYKQALENILAFDLEEDASTCDWEELVAAVKYAREVITKNNKLELPQEIETLKSENAKLRELIEIVRKYAIIEYADSASCRIIASEIQKAFPCSFTK